MQRFFRACLLLAPFVVFLPMGGAALAQSSSGYPWPGCQVAASTTGGDSAGHVASLQACTTACSLCDLSGYNNSGSTRYIQLFAATACPATNSIPLLEIPVATASSFSEFGFGEWYNGGLAVCVSTTEGKLTLTGSNDAYIHVAVSK